MPKKDAKQPQPKRNNQNERKPRNINANNFGQELTPQEIFAEYDRTIRRKDAEWKKFSYSKVAQKADSFWNDSIKLQKVVVQDFKDAKKDERYSLMPAALYRLANGEFKNHPTVLQWTQSFQTPVQHDQLIDNICLMRTIQQKKAEYQRRGKFMQWWYSKSYQRMLDKEEQLKTVLIEQCGLGDSVDYTTTVDSTDFNNAETLIIDKIKEYTKHCEDLEKQYETFEQKNITDAKNELEELKKKQQPKHEAQTKLNNAYKALKKEFYKTVPDREAWKNRTKEDKQKVYENWYKEQEKNAGKDADIGQKIADYKQAKTNFIEIWTKEQANTIRIQLLEKSLKEGKTVEELNEQATNKNVPEPINEDALLSEQLRIDEVVKDQENAYQEVNELNEPINEVEIEEPENEKSV